MKLPTNLAVLQASTMQERPITTNKDRTVEIILLFHSMQAVCTYPPSWLDGYLLAMFRGHLSTIETHIGNPIDFSFNESAAGFLSIPHSGRCAGLGVEEC